jgi:long-chain fatty acid transport protein
MSAGPVLAGGLFLYEVGTDDVGLAAAGYSARAQDASTLLTNPAGMTRLEGKQLLIGTQLLYADATFTPGTESSPGLGTGDGGNPIGVFPGASGFYTQQVSSDITLGMGLAGNFGLALEYDDDWVGRYYVRESELIGISLLPSIAYKVNEQFSVGASLNAMYGTFEDKVAVNNIAPGFADGSLKLDDKEWGWGANLAMLYELDPDTRFGLTYTSEVELDFKANAEFSGLAPGIEALLSSRGLLNAPIDLDINVPQTLMASMFHQLDDKWALLASIGWQDWSRFGQVEVGVDSSNPLSVTTDLPFKDTWHGAVGAQYQVNEPWLLNFGISYDSDFQKGPYVSPVLPANASWRFGVGARQQVSESFHWGPAIEYNWGGDLDVNQQGNPVEIGGRGNLVGTYKNPYGLFLAANFGWDF